MSTMYNIINHATKHTESIKNVERMNELYKDIQRINSDWLDLFWRPFLAKEEEKKDKTHKEEQT
jgi:hypothetical protein